ncbi:hypothetical protein HanXRQr2_Chr05g0203051 [Helianthus annuus]|uniref:Uncharacterized protein n=1 Tax=Helianthus annuus TaxID=4232 RepID=A0A9K3NLH4_HELAN|nr:hypothetical protein HanXRQr2_Chr05g0203051 [Helianthus annuus]
MVKELLHARVWHQFHHQFEDLSLFESFPLMHVVTHKHTHTQSKTFCSPLN